MARILVDKAIKEAPSWATHISVDKKDGLAEFYNAFDKDVWWWSTPVDYKFQDNAIPWGHCPESMLAGNNELWYLVGIAPASLENE